MRAFLRAVLTLLVSGVLVLTTLISSPAQAVEAQAAGKITCTVVPAGTLQTKMDTRVAGRIFCSHSKKLGVAYSIVPYVADKYGPFSGVAAVNRLGQFNYLPGYYPRDPVTGRRDRLPDYTGPDSFLILAQAKDGAKKYTTININITAPPSVCAAAYAPTTKTMFNDPSGGEAQQYQMLRELIRMINCTPAKNPDGTRASILVSFYSLTYAPLQAALTAAARRGVQVQALTNSHADKYAAWQQLAKTLGTSTAKMSFAATCWQGCLTPRRPPTPGGPTAWYDVDAKSLTGRTVVFRDRSIARTARIVSWKWNFGDGTRKSGRGPFKHTYKREGTYKTTLTVKDARGRTHTLVGRKAVPDTLEPEYPSLHSKIYLFSTVGTGKNARRWVSAYSSGNPTYQQSRKGFNNLNISVGDPKLYSIFRRYYFDLTRGSDGRLMTMNYFRSFHTAGNPKTAAPATTVHLGPQTVGDINRSILQSIKCIYKSGNTYKRTDVKVSMFVFTRKGVAADLWRLAMRHGCNVEIVYTQMSQKIKGVSGSGYGAADCFATPPTKTIKVKGKKRTVANDVVSASGKYCTGGTLKGKVPVTKSGMWVNRKSPYKGGTLKVRMSCPVAPKYDEFRDIWAVACIRNDIFTHHKTVLVNGFIRGKVQKYVMSGSANWSSPGLRASDEVITEIQNAGHLYNQYFYNLQYLKSVVARNSRKSALQSMEASGSPTATVDVRGMTDAQLEGQE